MNEKIRIQTKSLSEMVVINNGIDYKKNPRGNEEIPIYGTGGIMGYTSIALDEGPAVLSGRKGSINRPFYVEGKFWNVDTIFCLKPLGDNDAKWLYYSLLNTDMTKLNEATGVPSVTSKSLYRLKINYFDPNKQTEIAHILTTCDSAIEKIQTAIAKYKAIKQGLLHDLFTRGLDSNGKLRPAYSEVPELYKESELGMIPKEWEVKRLGDYLISLEAGVSVNSIDVSSTNYIAVLKTSAVFDGYFYPNENKVVVPKDIERVKTNPKADSIIISRMNTPLLVGECGYIDKDYPLLFLPDRLWQTVFRDKESICVLWLNFLLNTEKYKKIIKDSATGTSDSMKNITKNAFYELKIPMCTINEQNEIAKRLSTLDNKIQTEETLLQKYQSIKRGLMGDLLGGKKEVTISE